jgi:hypothetical protein
MALAGPQRGRQAMRINTFAAQQKPLLQDRIFATVAKILSKSG